MYDVPTQTELQDRDRMWRDVVAGRRSFDPSRFLGFINDLMERDDWQGLFADVPNGPGFIARLADFLARHRGGLIVSDTIRRLYFHPLKRNALEPERLVRLAQQHANELHRLAIAAGGDELRERLASVTAVWTNDKEARPSSNDLDVHAYDVIGDFFLLHEEDQPHWFGCLKEACYGMAANYNLQRYLMADFYSLRFDYGAYCEFWVGGGSYALDDGRCLVTSVERV
jgi:hypothetical protein